jgi:uncharacterized protein (DUF1501 family)
MDRRAFLARAVPVATMPFLVGGFRLRAYARGPLMKALAGSSVEDRVLVIVQMNGGNDGLNTVIPLDQYSALSAVRGNILIQEGKVLRLTSATGLHPAMSGMHRLYGKGMLGIVQGVGYPSPNFSHFRATDIWLTASDSGQVLSTGWMGRYISDEYPGYPAGFPTAEMPDPPAIQIGSVVSPGLVGQAGPGGIAVSSTSSTFTLPGGFDIPPDSPAGHELTYIRTVAEQTEQYSAVIRAAAGRARNLSTLYPTPGRNSLADQLKIVAQLIAGGLQTRIYVVNIGGFDTHSGQVVSGATDTGAHATLLDRLSVAVTAFMDDLQLLGIDQRVVGMTFSEFGRRITSNASLGTDHGTSAPMLLFGTPVSPRIFGSNPAIPATATSRDNLPMQHDFRAVYASILKDWLGASAAEVESVLLKNDFATLPLIDYAAIASGTGTVPASYTLMQNYPNPFNPLTTIVYDLPDPAHVRIAVYDSAGEEVAVLVDAGMEAGRKSVDFNGSWLSSGVYFYRMTAGSFSESRKMVLVR